MKKWHLLFLLIFLSDLAYAQDRFFTFVEGWRNEKVIEYDSQYLSIGLGYTNTYQNFFQFVSS